MLRVRVDLDRQRPLILLRTAAGITLAHHGALRPQATDCGLGGWTLPFLRAPSGHNPGVLVGGDGREHWISGHRRITDRLAADLGLLSTGLRPPLTLYRSPGAGLVVFDGGMQHVATRHGIVQSAGLDITYDARGWPATVSDRVHTLAIERASGSTTLRGRGAPIVLERDGDGRCRLVRSDVHLLELAYGRSDQLTSLHDVPSGKTWRFEYGDDGRLLTLLYPSGATRHLTRVDATDGHAITSMIDFERERRMDVGRDALGRSVRVTRCCAAPPAISTTSTRRPDAVVQLPDGSVWRRRVRGDGTLKRLRLVTPGKVSTEITARGSLDLDPRRDTGAQRHRRVVSDGATADYHYAPDARELTVVGSGGCTWTVRFDETGRMISCGHDGFRSLRVVHGAEDREVVVARTPTGAPPGAASTAEGAEVLLRATLVDGEVHQLLDVRSRMLYRLEGDTLAEAAPPPGVAVLTCRPLPTIVPETMQMPDGRTRAVDASGHYPIDGALGDSVPRPEITRDGQGRISSWRFGELLWRFRRDPWPGRIVRAETDGIVQRRRYDGPLVVEDEIRATVTTRLRASYTDGFRLRSRTLNGADPLELTWDGPMLRRVGPVELEMDGCPHRGRTSVSIGDTVMTETRTTDSRQAQMTWDGRVVGSQTFRYDASGRLAAYGETGTALGDRTVTYDYHPDGRLRAMRDGEVTQSVRYDANGVVTDIARSQDVVTVESDELGRVTRHGDARCRWDSQGRLVRMDGPCDQRFDYDDRGLLRATTRAGRRIEFQYDYRGRLIGRSSDDGALGYVLDDDGRLLGVVDATGTVLAEYVYAPGSHAPDAVRLGRRWCVVVVGPSESVRSLVDAATGDVVEQRRYGPWGEPLHHIAPAQPLGYACGIEEPEAGLVWFGSRWYIPSVGMWSTPDELGVWGGDPNLHRYVWNDPVNHVDPTGRDGMYIGIGGEIFVVLGGGYASAGIHIESGFGGVSGYADAGLRHGVGISAGGGVVIGENRRSGSGPPKSDSVGLTTPFFGWEGYESGEQEVSFGPTLGFDLHGSGWIVDLDDMPDPYTPLHDGARPYGPFPNICVPDA
jgi:RHS repeat-associated protein